ncbi:ABC transporter ATP-binding protein [Flavihumibacter sediminis]|nr:ABC transporter ATP-binding protein [Flavihumibacter sediminis]
MLQVSGISKKDQDIFILKDIEFSVPGNRKLALAGETGSGKSTLMKIIAGLLQPDEGSVFFHDKRVEGPLERLIPGHPQIAYLSQHFELRNNYRVEEILEIASKLDPPHARKIFEICQIEHLLKRKTDRVSGGERQRIAMARALVTSPGLLLLDEPYSNLDTIHKQIMKSVVEDIGEHLGVTCLLVSHDAADTLSWADEIMVMHAGNVVQWGVPDTIYHHPANAYVAGLFGKFNMLNAETAKAFAYNKISTPEDFTMLRPGQFSVNQDSTNSVKGKIKKVSFLGDTYELDIQLEFQSIVVKTALKGFTKGDTITVSINQESIVMP